VKKTGRWEGILRRRDGPKSLGKKNNRSTDKNLNLKSPGMLIRMGR